MHEYLMSEYEVAVKTRWFGVKRTISKFAIFYKCTHILKKYGFDCQNIYLILQQICEISVTKVAYVWR